MKRFFKTTQGIGLAAIAGYTLFALLPNTFANWFYDYFQFLPWWGVGVCVLLSVCVLCLPRIESGIGRGAALAVAAFALPVFFYLFRTRIHCFGGDMFPGQIPSDWTVTLESFVPPLPGKGRLDMYGFWPFFNFMLKTGFLSRYDGMTTMAAFGLYDILVGGLFVIVSVALFRKVPSVLFIVLTAPFVFNFFGNVDCYPLPICAAMCFLALTAFVFGCERPGLLLILGYCVAWLVCGWFHPIAGVVGFLPALICVRWLNVRVKCIRVPEWAAIGAFGVLFFAINIVAYGKSFFSAPWNDVPPLFSSETFVHALNIVVLPILPLAFFVLRGIAPRKEKLCCVWIWLAQAVCFLAAHFTQGANDQFPYSLYLMGVLIPWLALALRFPLEHRAGCCVVALNLLLLVPMVWVHSTDRTVARAQYLYPMDKCRHNKEMSWQTHLGLVLGDNLVDNDAHRKATLRVFDNGARRAEPAGFRGGNYLYHTAFLYHFGEFDRGRQQLAGLMRQDPSGVRYFLSTRPGFAYMNRQRLWDDLYALFPQGKEKPQLKRIIDDLKVRAAKERYCLKNPRYAVCPY